ECNATYFANAFMLLAYDFMSQVEAKKGESPPFKVPRLRFVKTALCLAHSSAISPSIRFAYMIEEQIQAKFVKYIHNGEPTPFVPPGDPNYEVAEFLCFTQHVQYIESKGLAFLSDYQGELFLLTDPQVMTSDLGKHTFGLGNIAECFDEFEGKHQCNAYCTWYGL
ncbi:hypothetical protein FA13DRAFT_1604268, partial [Coprinellus micaceus]